MFAIEAVTAGAITAISIAASFAYYPVTACFCSIKATNHIQIATTTPALAAHTFLTQSFIAATAVAAEQIRVAAANFTLTVHAFMAQSFIAAFAIATSFIWVIAAGLSLCSFATALAIITGFSGSMITAVFRFIIKTGLAVTAAVAIIAEYPGAAAIFRRVIKTTPITAVIDAAGVITASRVLLVITKYIALWPRTPAWRTRRRRARLNGSG
jgi:hypothetical protein